MTGTAVSAVTAARAVCYRRRITSAEHAHTWFHKGDMCIVSGRLESRDWEDKNGNKRRSWEVQCESIDFCGGKSEGKPKEEESDFIMSDESDPDDCPF